MILPEQSTYSSELNYVAALEAFLLDAECC